MILSAFKNRLRTGLV